MNQPSCSLSLDLDTCSNSSDSLSECETLTVPDPNDPVTVQKFVEETVVGPISLQKQNVDRISAINSQLHIGDVHKNFFHFHGNIKPPTKEETQENGGNEPNSHHSSGRTWLWKTQNLPFVIGVGLVIVIITILLTLNTDPSLPKLPDEIINRTWWEAAHPSGNLTPFNFSLQDFKIVVTHTKEQYCKNLFDCSKELRKLKTTSIDSGLSDIRYNFLVGGTGSVRVYEGQGWNYSSPENSQTILVALMGDFDGKSPSPEMCEEVKNFIEQTVKEKNWIFCNLQVDDVINATECPMRPSNCIQPKKT